MANFLNSLNKSLIQFIEKQQMFFVATAAPEGRINLSPKGLDSFKILDKQTVQWLNYTGSGNETAAHLLVQNRMTIMFCSFGTSPLILRIYGSAQVLHPNAEEWIDAIAAFPNKAGARNLFTVHIESVQTSCGYAVPEYEFKTQRSKLIDSALQKGEEAMITYWKEKNMKSIDGLPTGFSCAE